MTSLIPGDCVAFESFFHSRSWQTKVCNAIKKYLVPVYLKVPSTEQEWLSITEKFETRWQYPNAIGAINGKHVVMRKPSHGGSHYYNQKHSHSIILMAIAGPSYKCFMQMQGPMVESVVAVFGINVVFQKHQKTKNFHTKSQVPTRGSSENPFCLDKG